MNMKRLIIVVMLGALTVCIWGQNKNAKRPNSDRNIRELARKNAELERKNAELLQHIYRLRKIINTRPPRPTNVKEEALSFLKNKNDKIDSLKNELQKSKHRSFNPEHGSGLLKLFRYNPMVDSILKVRIKSSLGIDTGLVIINDIQTGEPLSLLGMKKMCGSDSIAYWPGIESRSPASIIGAATYLAVLENGGMPEDTLDIGAGLFDTSHSARLFDLKYRGCGDGPLSLEQGLVYGSNIICARSTERYLPHGYQTLDVFFRDMGLKYKGTISDYYTLQKVKISPYIMLDWVDSVAKCNVPSVRKGNVVKLQNALFRHVEEGQGKGAKSGKVSICGLSCSGLTDSLDGSFQSFVGYFPRECPRYSIYVELYRNGYSDSTNYAAEVFRDIAEQMTDMIR